MTPTEPDPPDSSDNSGQERGPSDAPTPDRRDQPGPGLFSRTPVLGIVLVAVLAVGAAGAIVAAVRSGRTTSATGAGGGILRVGVVGLPSLDPLDARDPKSVMVVDQLFDTLVHDGDDPRPQPALARSFDANPEQTAFTFHLAPGARFDDGTPVTSADVKFTLERIA